MNGRRRAKESSLPVGGELLLLSESGGSRYEAGLGAVGDLELREDRRDVVADGLLAEEEPRGDVCVRPALGEQLQDLQFSVS